MKKIKGIYAMGFVGVMFLVNQTCLAQSDYGKYQLGIYSMSGRSLGISPYGSSLRNQVYPTQHGFVGTGIYSFVQLRDDSTYQTAGFFRFMRIDFGIASRSGIFEPSPGTLVKVTSGSIDLVVLFPLSFKAAKEIDAYCSAGPALTYEFNRVISPPQPLPELSNIKLGYALEVGFRLKSGSCIGYRTMTQSGEFSYRVGSIFFGFSPQNLAKKKK